MIATAVGENSKWGRTLALLFGKITFFSSSVRQECSLMKKLS